MEFVRHRHLLEEACPACGHRGLERINFALFEDQAGSGSWTLARCTACSACLYHHTRHREGAWEQWDEGGWCERLAKLDALSKELRREWRK